MKQLSLFLIFLLTFLTACKKSENIGGYPENFRIDEKDSIVDIDLDDFYFFQNQQTTPIDSILSEKYHKELVFKIKHENNIDLYGKRILICDEEIGTYLYNGMYQDNIGVNIGCNYICNVNFMIYVLDDKTKMVHKFSSELYYPVFDKNVKVLEVELFEKQRFVDNNEIMYSYKIKNLKSEIEEGGLKVK